MHIDLRYPSNLMHIHIDYRLTGSGWAECTVSSDERNCVLTASYLSDALRNLVLAANGVLANFSALTFSFDEEPGEFRWVITAIRLNEIQVEVLWFPETWGGRPNSEGTSVYVSVCRPLVFAKAVADAAKQVLDIYGEKGYRDKWDEHLFPMGQYIELTSEIAKLDK